MSSLYLTIPIATNKSRILQAVEHSWLLKLLSQDYPAQRLSASMLARKKILTFKLRPTTS